MTFDNRGNQYFGAVAGVSPDGTNISTHGRGAPFGNGNGYDVRGGAVVVVNGTGAGQIRRIIDFFLEDALNGTGWFTVDAPFDVPLHTSASPRAEDANGASLISCIPFRGRSIFHRNRFEDTGAHQLYGIGLDTIVAENSAARFGGFKAWGQSRTGGDPLGTNAFFANPNVRNEWIDNRVEEGLRADHQGGPINVTVRARWPGSRASSPTLCPLCRHPHAGRCALLEHRLFRVLMDALCSMLCPNDVFRARLGTRS